MNNLKEALNEPEKVLFLDIETTGLSRVYDQVTVIGYDDNKKFNYHIQGDNIKDFENKLKKAKTLVTFNGKCFDVKFLEYHFPHLKFPEHHIDLRYLMRRVGYTGGQKIIEVELGIKREEDIKGVTGYEAVVLWHEYRRGNDKSLKKLIEYNHADVQGMKEMLSFALNEMGFKKEAKSLIKTKSPTKIKKIKQEKPRPKVYAKDLWKKFKDKRPIIGIDITGSEKRPSGFAILYKDNQVASNYVKPLPPVPDCPGSRVNYYKTQPNMMTFSNIGNIEY